MKRIATIVIVALAASDLSAQGIKASPVRDVFRANRDLTLEQSAQTRTQQIGTMLQPDARSKLDSISRGLMSRLASAPPGFDPYVYVQSEIHRGFAKISQQQSDLLCLYVVGGAAQKAAKSSADKDALADMSEMDQMRLQMVMDSRSKFIATLSNILKKSSETDAGIVQNIK